MNPFLINIPYKTNLLLNLFASISDNPWSMLLHSGHPNNNSQSRFDILVSSPVQTLIAKNGKIEIKNKNNTIIQNKDPFFLLQDTINAANIKAKVNTQLPFQGGLLGIIGYDLIRYIVNIPTIAKKDINLPDMAIGLYRWTIITDHSLCKTTLISHDNPDKLIFWIQKYSKYNNKSKLFKRTSKWHINMTRQEYKEKFLSVKKYLKNGDCYQICLSQRLQAKYTGNEWIAFRHLLKYNQAPFSAFIRLHNNQAILCTSPERFLHICNNNIETRPIKGTIARSQKINNDQQQIIALKTSSKNRAENLMIVDLLRNDIGKIALPGSIKVPELFKIETFSAVHHMVSTIIGKLPYNKSIYDLLRACFPGGSVTGAPKIRAMEIIEKLEPQRRNAWCGSIGYLSCCGTADFNIVIRTLIASQQKLFCSVGSAIVYESKEDEEYTEMMHKISSIINIL